MGNFWTSSVFLKSSNIWTIYSNWLSAVRVRVKIFFVTWIVLSNHFTHPKTWVSQPAGTVKLISKYIPYSCPVCCISVCSQNHPNTCHFIFSSLRTSFVSLMLQGTLPLQQFCPWIQVIPHFCLTDSYNLAWRAVLVLSLDLYHSSFFAQTE